MPDMNRLKDKIIKYNCDCGYIFNIKECSCTRCQNDKPGFYRCPECSEVHFLNCDLDWISIKKLREEQTCDYNRYLETSEKMGSDIFHLPFQEITRRM